MYKKTTFPGQFKAHLILKHHCITKTNTNEHTEYIEGNKQSIEKKAKKVDLVGDNTLWLDVVAVAKLG